MDAQVHGRFSIGTQRKFVCMERTNGHNGDREDSERSRSDAKNGTTIWNLTRVRSAVNEVGSNRPVDPPLAEVAYQF